MVKRNRDTSDYNEDYPPSRSVKPRTDSYIPPSGYARRTSYRRYGASSGAARYKSKYSSRKRYPGPKYRSIYARVNRNSPELKSIEIDARYFPVSYGDITAADTYAWTPNSAPTNIWNGNAQHGHMQCINLIGTGTDISNRIGRKVMLKSLTLNAIWRMYDPSDGNETPGSASTAPTAVRIAIIWDKSPLGLYPALSQIFYPCLDYAAGNSPLPRSPLNLANRDRFRVLLDIRDTLSPGGDSLRQYDKYIKINKQTIFNDGSTSLNIGSIQTGALYLVALSDAHDNQVDLTKVVFRPLLSYITRVRFTDC